jgi:hypothetical protein
MVAHCSSGMTQFNLDPFLSSLQRIGKFSDC